MFGLFKKATQMSSYNEGIITDTIYEGKLWRVHCESTEWFARSKTPADFQKNDSVNVVGQFNATTKWIEPA